MPPSEKRVVIVGPDFAPSSLPPALRIRFFARHLPAYGWEPTVVTVEPRYYETAVDPETLRLVPPGLRVVRTSALPARATRRVGIGDLGARGLVQQWRAAARLCRTERVDAVLLPVPPYLPAVIGRLLHARYRVPYVVDYIDPWVSDDWRTRPPEQRLPKRALADRVSRLLEPFALRRVAHIVGVSRGTTDGVVARYPWLRPSDATEIPYGAEAADFDYVREHPRANAIFRRADGRVHVSCVGRGGWDLLPALRAVFDALRRGLAEAPELFGRLRLHFVGTSYARDAAVSEQIMPVARDCGVAACVDEHPRRVPYLDALQILLDSDALLAVGSEMPHYTASKIFPCILAQRPLLAVFHSASSVIEILRQTGAGAIVPFDAESPPDHRVADIQRWFAGVASVFPASSPPTRWDAFEPYSARAMAGRLAAVLDRVAASRQDVAARGGRG